MMSIAISQIGLHTAYNVAFLLLAIVVVILFALYIYRRTNPIVPGYIKATLLSLRILALVLLLLLLFQSIITYKYTRTEPPIIAVAVDQSASMGIEDQLGSRPQVTSNLLQSDVIRNLAKKFDVEYFTFSSKCQPLNDPDSLQFVGDETNIAEALKTITRQYAGKNLAAIFLLSDGNYNQGGNPVRLASEMTKPIYTIGIGSSSPIPDLAITEVEANPFAYTGEATPITIKIKNDGFKELKTNLILKRNDEIIDSKIVRLHASPSEDEIELSYVPKEEGRKKLEVSVAPQKVEQVTTNNRKVFYIDVLKSRLKILLLSSSVSPEISFIRRYLQQNERYDVIVLVEKKGGGFYEQDKYSDVIDNLKDVDLFVFQDFPGTYTGPDFLGKVTNAIKSGQKPILFIGGKNTDFNKLKIIESYLPIRGNVRKTSETQVLLSLTPKGQEHPIIQSIQRDGAGTNIWSNLPPVFVAWRAVQVWPNTDVLLNGLPATLRKANTSSSWPILTVRSNGVQKSAAMLAYGLWRLDLMTLAYNNRNDVYSQLLNNLTRWLESTQSNDRVQLETDQSSYHLGDPIKITARVYDEKLRPLNDATVRLIISSKNREYEFQAQAAGDGKYSYDFFPEFPGEYEINMEVFSRNNKVGGAQTRITVGEYTTELSYLPAQKSLLKNLARTSGGAFFTPDSFKYVTQSIKGKDKKHTIIKEFELINQKSVLIFLLLLLSVEWFVRKKRGMV